MNLIFFFLILGILIFGFVITRFSCKSSKYWKQVNKKRENNPIIKSRVFLQMLGITMKKMDEKNIKPWIQYGTLLGKIRENDFICHDMDIDFEVLKKDKNDVLATINEIMNEYPEEYYVRYHDDLNINSLNLLGSINVVSLAHKKTEFCIDFDFVDIVNNGKEITTYTNRLNTKILKCLRKDFFSSPYRPIDSIFPLKRDKLCEIGIWLPNKPEISLEFEYGKSWKIPNIKCVENCLNCRKIKNEYHN